MKKIILSTVAAILATSFVSAQSVSLTNTFGGNEDNNGTSDFLKFDEDGNKQDAVVGDRIQLDVASENIDARVRLNLRGDEPNWAPKLQAYANFRPVEGLNFIGGNKFFWKWTTPGAYLAATDDYLTHGKLADDNGAGAIYKFSNDSIGLTFAGAVGQESRLDLNFGAQFDVNDVASFGVTAQDVTEKTITIGGYVAINAVENLLLNFGYTYNTNDDSYIAATQHLAQVSVGYTFADLGLEVYADLAAGLNNKVFSAEADDFVEKDDGIPVWGAVRAAYALNEKIALNGWVHVNHVLNDADNRTDVIVFPSFDFNTSVGTFTTGARVYFDDKDGYKGFHIPFSWQYKISK